MSKLITLSTILTWILGQEISAQPRNIDLRFSTLAATAENPIISRESFSQANGPTFYEDNTPEGGARFSYIQGEGLTFDNNSTSSESSQTAIYFNLGFQTLNSTEDFETRVVMELPSIYSNLNPNRFVAINSILFYGAPNNEYDNEVSISLTEASFASEGFNGRFIFFETEEYDGPPRDSEQTETRFLEVVWIYSSVGQSVQITITELELLDGSLVARDSLQRSLSVAGTNWFVPALGFESEGGQQVPPDGLDPVSANKPRIHSIRITRGDNNPPFEVFADSDGDGVADVLEERFGGNKLDPTDGRATVDYLTKTDLVSVDSIMEARPGRITIRKRSDEQFDLSVSVERSTDLINWIPYLNDSVTIPSPAATIEFLRLIFQ